MAMAMAGARVRVWAKFGAGVGWGSGFGLAADARRLHIGELLCEVVGDGQVAHVSAHQLLVTRATVPLQRTHRPLQLRGAVLCPRRGSNV
jgi:hypothetical protein